MNRAEWRRQLREQRKDAKRSESTYDSVIPRHLTADDWSGIRTMQVSSNLAPNNYGMPERAKRSWVMEHLDPDGSGEIPITTENQDGTFTHAVYVVDCRCDDPLGQSCKCEDDESIEWVLESFSG